jgi:hypothetical protein
MTVSPLMPSTTSGATASNRFPAHLQETNQKGVANKQPRLLQLYPAHPSGASRS